MSFHSALPLGLCCLCLATLGCGSARYGGADDRQIEHGDGTDSGLPPPADGGIVAMDDAWSPPGVDAWVPGVDAWVAPADDAGTTVCPTFAGDVQPLYQRHCATCHTTGREAHFGSSYSVATSGSSSCRTSMAQCTISLGRPGGSMARRDRLGGFSTTEQATIQAWIGCGMPM